MQALKEDRSPANSPRLVQNRPVPEISGPPTRWNIGVERNRVAIYIALALIGGFAAGFVTSRYLTPAGAAQKQLPSSAREAASLAGATLGKEAPAADFQTVTRVIRADMVEVEGVGPVQMIGVETPDGKTPSEIYAVHGQQALAFTQKSLLNQKVRLEFDPVNASSANKGAAGQTLAYIYTQDGTLFNSEIIKQGHGFVRVVEPFRLIDQFRGIEREAMQTMRGVWGFSGAGGGTTTAQNAATQPGENKNDKAKDDKSKKISPLAPSELGPNIPAVSGSGTATLSEQSVFVSTADRMYHKSGCEYLGKKREALSLSQAKAEGYASCSRCFASTVMKAR